MAKIKEKQENLTAEYYAIVQQLSNGNGLTPENLAKLTNFQRKNPEFMSSADVQGQLDGLMEGWRQDPKFQDLMAQMQAKQKSDKIAGEIAPFMQAVLAGTDISTAFSQTKSARRAGLGLRKPIRPNFRQSRELQSALDDARSRTTQIDPNVTNALKLQNLDSYTADLTNARTASTGQAGLYGSLAQSAINRRNRANLASAPVIQQMLQQNRSRYDNLLQQQQTEQARLNSLDLSMYGTDLNQYNNEAKAIGSLEATGRSNTRNALYNAAAIAPNVIGRLSTMYNRTPIQQTPQPRYTPDTNELGPDNAAYLKALQDSSNYNLYNSVPMKWDYNPNAPLQLDYESPTLTS